MSEPKNPHAFPQSASVVGPAGGMTLRDWFAGQALAGLLASPMDGPAGTLEQHGEHFARASFVYADAMLAARTAGERP